MHTPGPWKQDAYGHIKGTDGESIRCCGVALAHRSCVETVGNDNLICAAPQLLAALESTLRLLELLNVPGAGDPIEAAVYAARQAISKTKGAA